MAINKKKSRWLFPTNTNNLRMIIAQGLLTSPSGFSKYYQDVLSEHEGYLPLFNNELSAESLDKATSEAGHLITCLLELDIEGIEGKVVAFTKDGSKEVTLESLAKDSLDIEKIFIPLPLPVSCISKVVFKTKENLEGFKKDVEIKFNVILNDLKLQATKADSKLFESKIKKTAFDENYRHPIVETKSDSQQNIEGIDHVLKKQLIKPDYSLTYAYGGMLALLFYYAKNGEKSHKLFDKFIQENLSEENNSKDLRTYLLIRSLFFNGIDESLPENKMLKGIVSCCIESNNFKDSVIQFLQNNTWDEKSKIRTQELADRLQEYASTSAQSVSELFNSSKSDVEKALLMLFAREDSSALIDYINSKISFTEGEYLLFSLFFGIRDGFIKIPPMIRKYNGLQLYISNQMADYAHRKMKSHIFFKSVKRPLTVWQFVDKKLSKTVTKLLGIEDCVQTIMPKADFKHVRGNNVYMGYFEPTYKVVGENYFGTIATKVLSDTDYNKLK